MRRWADRAMGAVAMYLVSGIVVSTSMAVNTNGRCPWWLWPYWTATWLFQIFPVIYDGWWRNGWHF